MAGLSLVAVILTRRLRYKSKSGFFTRHILLTYGAYHCIALEDEESVDRGIDDLKDHQKSHEKTAFVLNEFNGEHHKYLEYVKYSDKDHISVCFVSCVGIIYSTRQIGDAVQHRDIKEQAYSDLCAGHDR